VHFRSDFEVYTGHSQCFRRDFNLKYKLVQIIMIRIKSKKLLIPTFISKVKLHKTKHHQWVTRIWRKGKPSTLPLTSLSLHYSHRQPTPYIIRITPKSLSAIVKQGHQHVQFALGDRFRKINSRIWPSYTSPLHPPNNRGLPLFRRSLSLKLLVKNCHTY